MILFIKFPPVIAVGAGAFIVQKDVRITLAQLFADGVKFLHIHCQNGSQSQLALFDFQNRKCLLEVAAQCLCSDDYKVATSVIRFLKLLSRTHSNEVLAFLELMKDRDAHYYQIAYEDVLTEINFY